MRLDLCPQSPLFSKSEINLILPTVFAKILTKAITLKALREEKSCWSAARARTRASFLTWLERALSPSLRSLVGFYARASKSASAQSGNPPRALEAVERELLCLEYRVCCPLVKKWFFLSNRGRSLYPLLARNYEGGSVKLQGLKFVRYVIFWLVFVLTGIFVEFLVGFFEDFVSK